MATIPVWANGTAANIAAATDGSAQATSISWANLLTDSANINAGDIIELYDSGGSYTAALGFVLEITSAFNGASGNPTIIRAATGETPVINPTGTAIGIEFSTGADYVEVDLDVTQGASSAAVHASGDAGTDSASHNFTCVYKGTITGNGGSADDGDGVSTDSTAEILLDGAVIQDIQLITPSSGNPQGVTCHTNSKIKAINNTQILNCNTAYSEGSATDTEFQMYGGVISEPIALGVENGSTAGLVLLKGVTFTCTSNIAILGHIQNNTASKLILDGCTFNLTGGNINQFDSDTVFRDCTFNLTNPGSFQLRQTQSAVLYFWGNTINYTGAIATIFRAQNSAKVDLQRNTFDLTAATGNGQLTTFASYTGAQYNIFYNNKLIGPSGGARAQVSLTDVDCKFNTFVNIGQDSTSERALDLATTGTSPTPTVGENIVLYNIFSNCLGNSGAILQNGTWAPVIDYNNYADGTADEGDTNGTTTSPSLNSNNESTVAQVWQGARIASSGGGGSTRIIDHNIIG